MSDLKALMAELNEVYEDKLGTEAFHALSYKEVRALSKKLATFFAHSLAVALVLEDSSKQAREYVGDYLWQVGRMAVLASRVEQLLSEHPRIDRPLPSGGGIVFTGTAIIAPNA